MSVVKQIIEGDRLFLRAESQAKDFSLFPESAKESMKILGILPQEKIAVEREILDSLTIDAYIERVVSPAEDQKRTAAPEVILDLGKAVERQSEGPYFQAILQMEFAPGVLRNVGIIAQDRRVDLGSWMPEHHLRAAEFVKYCSTRSLPIVSFMDTPGADPKEEANANNQAHSISRLIAEMSDVDVPNVGVVYGMGYSGGAIPLAASNLILSLRDAVFSTIQPAGLASIARRLNLSWQQCAKYVGVSAFELLGQGNVDALVDYAPSDPDSQRENLRLAIVTSIISIEERTKKYVSEEPSILEHYAQSLQRYLNPSEQLEAIQRSSQLSVANSPTEYANVFGFAYRYLRYLKVRNRIKSTTEKQYGRLSEQESPEGELQSRADRERRETFLLWLQDPDRVIYDDAVSKSWRNYQEKRQAMNDERGRLAQFIFGEPKQNYENARSNLLSTVGSFLYNRWKKESKGNLGALLEYLKDETATRQIIQVGEIDNFDGLISAINGNEDLRSQFRELFSHEGKKILDKPKGDAGSPAFIKKQLVTELNMIITGPSLKGSVESIASSIEENRLYLHEVLPNFVNEPVIGSRPVAISEASVLDLLLNEELRADFIGECEDLLIFDTVYDHFLGSLSSIASEAQVDKALSQASLVSLLDEALQDRSIEGQFDSDLRTRFIDWLERISSTSGYREFLISVESWKKQTYPHIADALFVVVSHVFSSLLTSLLNSERYGKNYQGRISPRAIGRRKDFWNRLDMAYNDLQLQQVLQSKKKESKFTSDDFIQKYLVGWKEMNRDLLSADPCVFPGFRLSIEAALNKNIPPCGVVTGIAGWKETPEVDIGVIISNVEFQAGAFDMASAEKVIKLLTECARQHLPVVAFISSGGMQTKEGAGALFSMAAVNDRITRFVRDHDLPFIVFGYGDCTGGAQASFVTHPLAQTYYFSGTSMPFAGQIVVPSNLPLKSVLSNYLSGTDGAMQGLVTHPFIEDLDELFRRVDPEIPTPGESVTEVVSRILEGRFLNKRPIVVAHEAKYTESELIKPVRKVLVHARGCTATKLVRIAKQKHIEVVLVQSDPDMDSVASELLTEEDTLVCIGGNTPDESYLNALSVLNVAESEKVDSLHPGIGFLSESSPFARLVRSRGINFIGPPVSSMETMGNKSNAINTAMKLGVPVVPGSHGVVTDVKSAALLAEGIGYPILIKAVHGGGGKGIQVVRDASEFEELFFRVSVEAKSAFGNGDVYLEKYVTSLRHIEVQLLRDSHGNTKIIGVRDCSVQRDKQKVIEESGSTLLTKKLLNQVVKSTEKLADAVDYIGAGTVEFIYDLSAKAVYFMEMNTRLQVEHPVTEWTSGVNLVGSQFDIASGGEIKDLEIKSDGYAIEARVNAEKLVRTGDEIAFRPHPGEIKSCIFPSEDGVEIIASVNEGKSVSPYYDSMIAQVIVYAEDRGRCAEKLVDYLESVRIEGVSTNMPLLMEILKDEIFLGGKYDTDYLPNLLERLDVGALISIMESRAGDAGEMIDAKALEIEGTKEIKVVAPSSAIFYSTPSPSEPDYVQVGSRITTQDTLCQLEAMKIFTPLRLSDFNSENELYDPEAIFEVKRININSGQQINAGDLLFVVEECGGGQSN